MSTTPERLREAAAILLSERPAAKVSLREITDAARANVAAVGYHFRSKDALMAEVVQAAIEATTAHQREALRDLPDDASLETIVRTWLAPALTDADGRAPDRSWLLLRHQLGDTTPAVRKVIDDAFADVGTVLLRRLQPHVPHLDEDELRLRHLAVLATLGGLTTLMTGRMPTDPLAATMTGARAAVADQLVAFLLGGLTAPSARGAPLDDRGSDP